ncbi:MAG: fimbrillin family protein, partial [Rikenellaceae bacterium]|nr:fimbrillin family protein [Rikenellaceae bacterium]
MNRIFTILSALSLLLVSCEQFETPTFNNSNEGKVRVTITSGTPQSRTSIAENGLSTTWCNDDQIAVWASNGSSNVLNAQPFAVYYAMGSYVEFTADINPMGDGNFTYYSTHPLPASISGTTATFPIERLQQGSFDGSNDILVAYPTTGLALDNEEAEVSLTFKHKMHSLRMFVPDDVEGMGEPIRRVDITFPTQVVGNVSVDYTSATTPATLSNGSEVVSIEIPEGLSASSDSDRKYAYAIVFPATMNESDQITFTVRSDNYRSVQSFGARSL